MSTAGKVLVVLVTLSLMAWIVLFSAIAQFNTNWGQKLAAQDAQILNLRTAVDAAVLKITKTQDEISAVQSKMQGDLTLLRTNLSDAEKVRSESVETNARYQIDLQTVQSHAKTAATSLARREREHAEATRQLAEERALVKRYQGENDVLLSRFSKLQKDFLDTMAANKDLSKKAATTARVKQASFAP